MRGTLEETNVHGTVQLFGNAGEVKVYNNIILGDLECKENKENGTISGANNMVGGNKEGECSNLTP